MARLVETHGLLAFKLGSELQKLLLKEHIGLSELLPDHRVHVGCLVQLFLNSLLQLKLAVVVQLRQLLVLRRRGLLHFGSLVLDHYLHDFLG